MGKSDFQLLAVVIAAGGQVVVGKQHKVDAGYRHLQIEHRESTEEAVLTAISGYGKCPYCDSAVVERERRPYGNDKCENGHIYPSRLSVKCGS